jgi:hypothetical protein
MPTRAEGLRHGASLLIIDSLCAASARAHRSSSPLRSTSSTQVRHHSLREGGRKGWSVTCDGVVSPVALLMAPLTGDMGWKDSPGSGRYEEMRSPSGSSSGLHSPQPNAKPYWWAARLRRRRDSLLLWLVRCQPSQALHQYGRRVPTIFRCRLRSRMKIAASPFVAQRILLGQRGPAALTAPTTQGCVGSGSEPGSCRRAHPAWSASPRERSR